MKFTELKANLNKEVLPCYLIKGEDYFLCEHSINLIEQKIFGTILRTNLNKQTFSTENLDVTKFIDTLNTMPFFAEKKLVILKEYECKNSNEIISQLKEYIKNPNPSTVLVIFALNTLDFFKPLLDKVEVIDCSRLEISILKKWISQKLKSKTINNIQPTITPDATDTLINYTNGYLTKIDKELDKLINYSGGNIEKSHVENLVPKDLEYSIFELTNCIVNGSYDKAELIKNDLMSNRKTLPSVMPLISNYFRRLFYSLISEGTTKEIASKLGIKEYAVIKAKEQARKFGAKKLKEIVELSANLDYKTKTSVVSVENATNLLFAKILVK